MNGWLRTYIVYYETLEVASCSKVMQNMSSADKGFAITIHKMQGILPSCSNQRVVQRACASVLKMQDCLVTTKQITVRFVKTQVCVKGHQIDSEEPACSTLQKSTHINIKPRSLRAAYPTQPL